MITLTIDKQEEKLPVFHKVNGNIEFLDARAINYSFHYIYEVRSYLYTMYIMEIKMEM